MVHARLPLIVSFFLSFSISILFSLFQSPATNRRHVVVRTKIVARDWPERDGRGSYQNCWMVKEGPPDLTTQNLRTKSNIILCQLFGWGFSQYSWTGNQFCWHDVLRKLLLPFSAMVAATMPTKLARFKTGTITQLLLSGSRIYLFLDPPRGVAIGGWVWGGGVTPPQKF